MIILLVSFAALCLIGLPIAISLGVSTLLVVINSGAPLTVIVERIVQGGDSFLYVAIPLFILAANMMNECGVTDRLFYFARTLVGQFHGGIGHANIVAELIFSGISGSAVADAAALSKLVIGNMDKQGYPRKFSAALMCAASVIGPIFPPSIPFVIYGGMAEVSVGRLFMAGVVPGIVIAICLMVLVYYKAARNGYPRDVSFAWSRMGRAFLDAFWSLLAPVVILSGIVLGWFTPTEAAAFAVFYALVLGLWYRTFSWAVMYRALQDTVLTSAVVMFIIAASGAFSWVITIEQVGDIMVKWLTNWDIGGPTVFFILSVNIVLLVLGMLMDSTAILIIVTPFLIPVAQALQIDLVYFGVMMILNLMIGLVTPPYGMSLFTVARVAEVPMEEIISAIFPFILMLLVSLLLIIVFPTLTLWFPSLVM